MRRQAHRDPDVKALLVAERYGMVDGVHHKQWVIDQMVRAILGDDYAAWREAYRKADDADRYPEWDEGIAP